MESTRSECLGSESGLEQEHENETNGASFFRTCFNGVNTLTGVGLLSIPYAFAEGGWLSLTLLVVIAIVCGYTGVLLKRCMDANSLIKTYPDIGEEAFGVRGRFVVSIFIYVELYLVAVEFLILEGDNLHKLFPNARLNIWGMKIEGKLAFVVLAALLILPTTWLRSLKSLAFVSVGGVLASFVVVASVLCVGVFGGVGFHDEGEEVLNVVGLPTAVSLFTFCYCGHAVFPTLCSSMKNRRRFPEVIAVCFIVSTLIYAAMGVIGYSMFGQNAKSQITLNLPVGNIGTYIAIYTVLLNPITKYAIVVSPIISSIEQYTTKYITGRRKNPTAATAFHILLRTVVVISTVVVALAVPFFGYVMAFIGGFLGVFASILLPCVCYLKIHGSARRFGANFVGILGIMAFGMFICVMGTYKSVKQIVNHL